MSFQIKKTRKVIRYEQGDIQEHVDHIVVDQPITIKINREEFATIICTSDHVEDLVVGFLASEGVITHIDDIKNLWIQESEGFAHVETNHKIHPLFQKLYNKRYLTSCCGKSRQSFIFLNDVRTVKRLQPIDLTLSFQDCFQLMADMQVRAHTFTETGGVHNAALYDSNNHVLSRMDIGRHNALEKIYGYSLRNNIALQDKVIVFSGRISSEILIKVAKWDALFCYPNQPLRN